MSVQTRESIADFSPGEHCFLCGEILPSRFVFWHGNDDKCVDIGLCEECADVLAVHLLKDAAVCRLENRGGPP